MLFKDRIEFANVTRYFDLIQHHVLASTVDSPLAKVDIDLNAPYVARQPEEKKPKKNEEPSKKEVKVDKKLEKPAKEAKTEQKKETSAARKGHCDLRILAELSPSRIDLRVGYIKSVSKHPQADSLYVEEIDVGEEKPRQVVSGLVKFIPEDQLMNRHVVLVCNLKPAKMRGVESQAMVLCASNADKSVVELVIPPAGSKPGDVLWFDGHQGTVDAQLKPKEKVWETVQPHFKTTDKLECGYMDPKTQKLCYLKSEKGVCRVTSIAQGSLS
jgi:aminoacyl tRNA synthase complex-interacting multifunctional protein 1